MVRARRCLLSLVLLLGITAFSQALAVFRASPTRWQRAKRRLGGVKPRYYQEEAVQLFFQRAQSIRNEKSRPMRLQLVGGAGKTLIYSMIATRSLSEHPSSRAVIFVPWRPLAVQTCQKLRKCGLHTCMLGDGQNELDPLASVVVCVYNSAYLLRGQHFRVKIVDEAHHLLNDGFLASTISGITADLEAEFTATFSRGIEFDYLYSFEKAVHDGYVCDLDSYILPLATSQRTDKLAEFIRLKIFDWSPMLILFNKLGNARRFAAKLQQQGLRAETLAHRDRRTHREMCRKHLENGKIQALCCVRLFNEGTDIPALRTVVIADTRPSSDVGVLQAAMRSLRLHKTKADDKAQIVSVVNATGSVSTVTSRVKRSVEQLAALWEGMSSSQVEGAGDLLEKMRSSRLRFIDLQGETFTPSNNNLWNLVAGQVESNQTTVSEQENASRHFRVHLAEHAPREMVEAMNVASL